MEVNDPNVLQTFKLLHDELLVSGKMLNARKRVSVITAQARKRDGWMDKIWGFSMSWCILRMYKLLSWKKTIQMSF